MKTTPNQHITTTERQRAVASAIGSVRIEGLEPSPATIKCLHLYAEGKISLKRLQSDTLTEIKKPHLNKRATELPPS